MAFPVPSTPLRPPLAPLEPCTSTHLAGRPLAGTARTSFGQGVHGGRHGAGMTPCTGRGVPDRVPGRCRAGSDRGARTTWVGTSAYTEGAKGRHDVSVRGGVGLSPRRARSREAGRQAGRPPGVRVRGGAGLSRHRASRTATSPPCLRPVGGCERSSARLSHLTGDVAGRSLRVALRALTGLSGSCTPFTNGAARLPAPSLLMAQPGYPHLVPLMPAGTNPHPVPLMPAGTNPHPCTLNGAARLPAPCVLKALPGYPHLNSLML